MKKKTDKFKQPSCHSSQSAEEQYKEEYCLTAYELCLLGLENKKIAKCLGVTISTFNHWLKNIEEFQAILRTGRDIADGKVATALYKRAIGYEHPDLKVHFDKLGEVHTFDYTKYYPPDTAAAQQWLKLRQKELWKDNDVVDLNHHLGKLPTLRDLFGQPDKK